MSFRETMQQVFSPAAIASDIRAVAVSAVVGAVVASLVALVYASSPEVELFLDQNVDGFGTPRTLFTLVRSEGDIQLSFEPEELENVYVCESKLLTSSSFRTMLLDYLSEYNVCFIAISGHGNSLVVLPNRRTGQLSSSDDESEFYCKC